MSVTNCVTKYQFRLCDNVDQNVILPVMGTMRFAVINVTCKHPGVCQGHFVMTFFAGAVCYYFQVPYLPRQQTVDNQSGC